MNDRKKIVVTMRAVEEFVKVIEVDKDALSGDIKEQAYEDFEENHYNNWDDSWEYDFGGGRPEIEFVDYEEEE